MQRVLSALPRVLSMLVVCVVLLGVFDRARASGNFQITLVSKNVSGTGAANDFSFMAETSTDGNRTVFVSDATDLTTIPILPMTSNHVYVYDHALGTVTMVDKNVSGTASGNDSVGEVVALSDDGSIVLFGSDATDLTNTPDSNGTLDVFLYDVDTDTTTNISMNNAGTSTANSHSVAGAISADGTRIVFSSEATNLTADLDNNHVEDVYLYDVPTDTMTLVSKVWGSGEAGSAIIGTAHISADGSAVVFCSYASNLTGNVDTNGRQDVFLYEVATGELSLISKNAGGTAAGNGGTCVHDISNDGRMILLDSGATDLTADVGVNRAALYLYDTLNDTMTLITKNYLGTGTANGSGGKARLSATGSRVVFESRASDLTADPDTNGTYDIFLYDVQTDSNQLVTINLAGTDSSGGIFVNRWISPISADGNLIIFSSNATDLTSDPDTNDESDVYLYDALTDTLSLLTLNLNGTGAADDFSKPDVISADGSTILIHSTASDLTDNIGEVFGTNVFHIELVPPLNKPTQLSAVPISQTEIDLSWTDNSLDETSFIVKRSADGLSGWVQIGTTNADDTTYSDTGLTCNTTYYYLVRGYRAGDDVYSADSTFASATTDPCQAPTDLTADPISQTQIDLTWTDNADDETSFRIERSPNGVDSWIEIGTTSADDITYSDTSAACNTTYHYRVRAHRSGDNAYSDFTNTVEASTWTCGVFADVPVEGKAWMQDWIEQFYAAGITTGCGTAPSGQPIYCPEASTTRAEMAVFIIRALNYGNLPYTPTDPDDHFDDVPVLGKEWMQAWIEEFYDLGITTGCAKIPLRYCPERPVTRAEMAVFLLRALEGSSYQPPAASHYFDDVPVTGKAWMEAWIDEFYRRGITTGCDVNPLRYCPEREVTRAEMAVFIIRAFESIPNP